MNIVMKNQIQKLLKNPIRSMKLMLDKWIVGRIKYGKKDDYDAAKYWHDRLSKYKTNIQGPGEEGMSEKDNLLRYKGITDIFKNICKERISAFDKIKVLEIGTGTGMITQILYDLGVKDYHGIDITDSLFPDLRRKFRGFQFTMADITQSGIKEVYDLIVIIDVIEHIVNDDKFVFAMNNLRNALSDNGVLIIAPFVKKNKKELYYERHWELKDLQGIFTGCFFGEPTEWEKDFSSIVAISKCSSGSTLKKHA